MKLRNAVIVAAIIAVLCAQANAATPLRFASFQRPASSSNFALYAEGWFSDGCYSGCGYTPYVCVFDDGGVAKSAQLMFPYDYVYSSGFWGTSPMSVSDAYVFEADDFRSTVYAWPIGATAYGYTIPQAGPPQATAVDPQGDLYVLTGSAQIAVFQPGSATAVRVITKGVAGATTIAVDSRSYLYAGGASTVTVYKAGATKPMETITQGISGVVGLAVGGRERLYVANLGTTAITAYTFGTTTPTETITQGLQRVGSVAVGPTGTLYAKAGYGLVTEYDKGGTTLSRKVSIPACCNGNIVVDPNDTLYAVGALASNSRELRIYTVPSQSKQWKRHLRSNHAYDLAIGPAW